MFSGLGGMVAQGVQHIFCPQTCMACSHIAVVLTNCPWLIHASVSIACSKTQLQLCVLRESICATGMALGTGSALAHRAVDSVLGSRHPEPAQAQVCKLCSL